VEDLPSQLSKSKHVHRFLYGSDVTMKVLFVFIVLEHRRRQASMEGFNCDLTPAVRRCAQATAFAGEFQVTIGFRRRHLRPMKFTSPTIGSEWRFWAAVTLGSNQSGSNPRSTTAAAKPKLRASCVCRVTPDLLGMRHLGREAQRKSAG
jgi:hypothetical protein